MKLNPILVLTFSLFTSLSSYSCDNLVIPEIDCLDEDIDFLSLKMNTMKLNEIKKNENLQKENSFSDIEGMGKNNLIEEQLKEEPQFEDTQKKNFFSDLLDKHSAYQDKYTFDSEEFSNQSSRKGKRKGIDLSDEEKENSDVHLKNKKRKIIFFKNKSKNNNELELNKNEIYSSKNLIEDSMEKSLFKELLNNDSSQNLIEKDDIIEEDED